jgi:hypothetical protein
VQRERVAAVACGLIAWASACNSSDGSAPLDVRSDDASSEAAAPGDGGALDAMMDSTLSGNEASPGDDASGAADASDGGSGEASPGVGAGDGGGDASDAGPTTTLLVPGANFTIHGITSDDYVAYYDRTGLSYQVKPIDGGPAIVLDTVPPSLGGDDMEIVGKVVFTYEWNANYLGKLVAWSSGTQPIALTANGLAYLYQTAWASDDGQYVAFLQAQSASTSNLIAEKIDGTGRTLLATNVNTNPSLGEYFPHVVFRGGTLVAGYCTGADAGTVPTLRAFSIPNAFAPVTVTTNWITSALPNLIERDTSHFAWLVDPSGTQVLTAAPAADASVLQAFPVDGGPGTVIDPTVPWFEGQHAIGSIADPWQIFYNDDAGTLRRSATDSPAPVVLADGGVTFFDAVSPDGKWMTVSNIKNGLGFFDDISLVSTSDPGTPHLIATQTAGNPVASNPFVIPGPGFTADSKYAIAFTDIAPNSGNKYIGNVKVMPVDGPYTTQTISLGLAMTLDALGGSRLLLMDNYQEYDAGILASSVDLAIADAATGARVAVAPAVPGDHALSHDRTRLVYRAVRTTGSGIYVTTLP